MFNFTDTNPTLFNLHAEPFWGMLVFLRPGTSHDYVNVTDVDDNNLGHIVTTNHHGRLETQIFLHNTVDVQMWEFTGTEFNPEDLTQFTLIRTERVIDPTDAVKIKVDGAQTVNTMDELRAIDISGYDDYTTLFRMGYYKGGDHEPLAYYWDSKIGGNDDGGYVIKPNSVTGMGRWIAIFPDRINVLWYGVKASDLRSTVTYHSSAVMAAVNRSMIMGKTLYFPSTASTTFYGVDNISINVGNADIKMDAGVVLVGKANTTNTISCYNLYCDRDRACIVVENAGDAFSVKCNELWTKSVASNGALHANTVHWNDSIRQQNWDNCKFYMEVEPPSTMGFTNCELYFKDNDCKFEGTAVQYTFNDMDFTDRYFKTGTVIDYGYVNVNSDCLADLDNFDNSLNWFNLMQDWGKDDINCQGRRMNAITLKIDTVLTDVNIGALVVEAGHHLTINNGHVDGIAFSDATKQVTLTNVTIGGHSVPTNIMAFGLKTRNVVLEYASANISASQIDLDRSQFTCPLVCNNFVAGHCEFTGKIACNNFTAQYCLFNSDVEVYHKYSFQVVCLNNTFGQVAYMKIQRSAETPDVTAATAINCQWIGNNIQNRNFWIILDRTYLEKDDTKHSYVYKNNTGACIQPGDDIFYNLTLFYTGSDAPSGYQQCLWARYRSDSHGYGLGILGVWERENSPFNNIFLFTIGTENVGIIFELELLGYKITEGQHSIYTTLSKVGVNTGVPNNTRILHSTDRISSDDVNHRFFTSNGINSYLWTWSPLCLKPGEDTAGWTFPSPYGQNAMDGVLFSMDSASFNEMRYLATWGVGPAPCFIRLRAKKYT